MPIVTNESMMPHLNDETINILYHALGADLTSGLVQFSLVFQQVEAEYRMDDVEALIDLLADPTLHDERLPAWHYYYTARQLLQQRQLQKLKQWLEEPVTIQQVDSEPLQARLNLLQGQALVMQGMWIEGRDMLQRVANTTTESDLITEAEEWIARSFMGRAQSSGGWAEPSEHTWNKYGRRLLTVALFPFYGLIWLFFKRIGTPEFWRPALQYGTGYSNWPIFWYYLNAHQALRRARQIGPDENGSRPFRLDLLQADLWRQLGASREAEAMYRQLKNTLPPGETSYRQALLQHGQAQALLDQNKHSEVRPLLQTVSHTYEVLGDSYALAYVDLLRGDTAVHKGDYDQALSRWRAAMKELQKRRDVAGLAEGLGRYYDLLTTNCPDETKDKAWTQVESIEPKGFVVRLPSQIFDILQLMAWIAPLLLALSIAIPAAAYIIRAPVADMVVFARAILSWRSLLVGGGFVLTVVVVITLLGLIGLITTLRQEAVRLDIITVDSDGICRGDVTGHDRTCLKWSEVTRYLRVERGWGRESSRTFSFDEIRTGEGVKIRLPGTTTWFTDLQQTLAPYTGTIHRYQLRWVGVQFIGLSALLAAGLAIVFQLTQMAGGGLSVATRSVASPLLLAGIYLVLFFFGARWIWHYGRVYGELLPVNQLAFRFSALAVFMLAVGVLGKQLLFLFAPLLIFSAVVLLWALVWHWRQSKKQIHSVVGILAVGIAFWLLLRAMLPILINLYAFTYYNTAATTAVQGTAVQGTASASERAHYFEQMELAGQWMVAIDSTYFFGHGYIGYGRYFEDDYEESIRSFNQAIRFSGNPPLPDYYYCRALVYDKLEEERQVEQNCQLFLSQRPPAETLCEILFAAENDVCVAP